MNGFAKLKKTSSKLHSTNERFNWKQRIFDKERKILAKRNEENVKEIF
jgi:hypothetical protein